MSDEFILDDKYIILNNKKNGKGLTSEVFKVEDIKTKKIYVAKILLQHTRLFDNEREFLNLLKKKGIENIVNIIDSGDGDIRLRETSLKKQYIILDYAEKGDLSKYITLLSKGFTELHAKLLFSKILKAVKEIHKNGVCHRDLKTANILLDNNFNPKICDFGFATEIKGKDGSGKLSDFLGTKSYAAPEIFLNKEYDGIKVDIFSLGVILLNLVTCKIGFVKATLDDKYYKNIIFRNYILYWKLLKNHIGEISNELKELYLKMVDYNPDKRPNIEAILKDPWMKEINDLNDEEYKKLENEVYNKFKELEVDVISKMEED